MTRTASISGAYAELISAVIKNLPRDLNDSEAEDWAQRRSIELQRRLRRIFLPPLRVSTTRTIKGLLEDLGPRLSVYQGNGDLEDKVVDAAVEFLPLGKRIRSRQILDKYPDLVDLPTYLTCALVRPAQMQGIPTATIWTDSRGLIWTAYDHGGGQICVCRKNDEAVGWDPQYSMVVKATEF
jgi:hypothetical protein